MYNVHKAWEVHVIAAHYVSVHDCHVMLVYIVCKTKIKCLCYKLWHIHPTNELCSLVPRISPRMTKNFSVLQVTESWAGLGNDGMNSVASTIVHLQYPAVLTKSHVTISLNSRTKTVRKWCHYLQNFWKLSWASLGIKFSPLVYCEEFVLWTPNIKLLRVGGATDGASKVHFSEKLGVF